MSTKNEAEITSQTPDKNSCTPSCGCNGFLRALPFLLIAAAAVLYFREILGSRTRTAAVNEIRQQVSQPLVGVTVSYRPEGRDIPIRAMCPLGIATNLLAALAQAEPTKFPKGEVEGRELDLILLHTNKTTSVLEAALLEDDSEALYVRSKRAAATNEQGVVESWYLSSPVRVPDAGPIVARLLTQLDGAVAKLPADADLIKASTNEAFRAALEAALQPEADEAASTESAPAAIPAAQDAEADPEAAPTGEAPPR